MIITWLMNTSYSAYIIQSFFDSAPTSFLVVKPPDIHALFFFLKGEGAIFCCYNKKKKVVTGPGKVFNSLTETFID